MKEIAEQRQIVCLKMCVANGISFANALKMLKKAYGESVLSKEQAFEYYKTFNKSPDVTDDKINIGKKPTIDKHIPEVFDSDSNSISKMFSTEDRSRTPSSSSQQDQESQDFQSSVNFDEIFEVNEDEEEHEDKSPANKKRRLNDSHTPLEDALKCIKTLLDENDKRDEHSVYGEHIANKLRNCNRSNSDIAIAQHHIENIVFNLSMGVYREEAENSIDNKTNLMIPPVNTRDVPDPIILTVPDPVIIPKPEPSP
ncbi:uncharacterized protein LOC129915640 isoform X2 [Episyrphus balteatus]|uniref:uncharacterized protein LOC129915640 isoform X2 n=1 Tax=Episyrphus balteatus TaxID=286459 RepID=UPI0024858605|nr:uncharacterized protein LOC129915640 isoform X2 [Episyrphus balteatus]XP_055851256.1 uncharacterized protein LOC129915640 isoform X2 [Episyrphus balteatus]